MLKPEDIISAFDEILDYVYTRPRGRDNPHISDKKTAQKWIDDGITLPVACAVFYHRMSVMHERWLRQHDHKDRTNIPASLKVFDENIEVAIRQIKSGGQMDTWTMEESRWRSRMTRWLKSKQWLADHWGPEPDKEGNWVPRSLLAELLPRERKNAV